jgi:hypothetical protein
MISTTIVGIIVIAIGFRISSRHETSSEAKNVDNRAPAEGAQPMPKKTHKRLPMPSPEDPWRWKPYSTEKQDPDSITQSQPGLQLVTDNDAYSKGAMAFRLDVYITGREGTYFADKVYIKVMAIADCPLRGRIRKLGADMQFVYSFSISEDYDTYDIVPLSPPGQAALWSYHSPQADSIAIDLDAAPYKLFLLTVVVEGRDETESTTPFHLESKIIPFVRPKDGYFIDTDETGRPVDYYRDSCLNLDGWYSSSLLRPPRKKSLRSEFRNLLAYQMAISEPYGSPRFMNDVLGMNRSVVLPALAELTNFSKGHSQNSNVAANLHAFQEALEANPTVRPCLNISEVRAMQSSGASDAQSQKLCRDSFHDKVHGAGWRVALNQGEPNQVEVVCSCDFPGSPAPRRSPAPTHTRSRSASRRTPSVPRSPARSRWDVSVSTHRISAPVHDAGDLETSLATREDIR